MFIKCFFKGLTVSPPVFIFTYYIALVGVTLVPLLITIAFFTLAERKIIAAIQRRKGPNVVGFLGILQPFADGLKLVLKEILFPMKSNIGIFLAAPLITLILSFLGWSIISFSEFDLIGELNLSLLVLFAISSLSVYGLILAGWSKQL
jgi:NADH-quinone oxidoreductase subunit H